MNVTITSVPTEVRLETLTCGSLFSRHGRVFIKTQVRKGALGESMMVVALNLGATSMMPEDTMVNPLQPVGGELEVEYV